MLPLLLAVTIAQAAPPAPTLVDRFVAAFPVEERPEFAEPPSDEAEANHLITLNPGRAAEIRAILETHTACATPLMRRMSENGLRWVAERLGEEKLASIVRYYESGDAAFLGQLDERAARGEPVSAADQARVDRILADYPLQDYVGALEATMARDDPLASQLFACDHARDDAYRELGLRFSDDASE